jgi:hypothetical protein
MSEPVTIPISRAQSPNTLGADAHGSNAKGRCAVLLTCYMSGATEGRNLGTAGYSYDFVARLFADIFENYAKVIPVPDPAENLDQMADEARRQGYEPVHISFLPFQDAHLCSTAPNIVVPAWEFPDVPNEPFADDERNDWISMANRCDLVIVGGPFTVESMKRGGTETPIRVVPVPTPAAYFETPDYSPHQRSSIDCEAYWPPKAEGGYQNQPLVARRKTHFRQSRKLLSQALRSFNKGLIGPEIYAKFSDRMRQRRRRRGMLKAQQRYMQRRKSEPAKLELPYPKTDTLDLSGVVYTSIFNPDDGRKNWQDLLTSFLYAIGDQEDATLIVKLITHRQESAQRIIEYYRQRDIPHRCKVGFVVDFLDEQQMQQLAQASTYYLQTTKAEGNCLPLMNFLSAGRPGISPCHSAISDYFDEQVGFVIDSRPEPAVWPHDPQLRFRTTWGRVVWPSAVDAIRRSYDEATKGDGGYQRRSQAARERMRNWASLERVEARVRDIFDELKRQGHFSHIPNQPTAIEYRRTA